MQPLDASSPARLGRSFRWLWLATAVTNLGDGFVLVAFPLLAAQLTDQPLLVASVLVAAELPWLLLSLPFGAVVDRSNRRRLLPRVELVRAALLVGLGVLVALDAASLPVLLVVAFSVGVGQTIVGAGTFALLPEIVPTGQLGRANGYLLATETATNNMLGPALGGAIFAAAAAAPFFVDGASFAASALLLFVAIPRSAPVPAPTTRLRDDIREGWRTFASDTILRRLAATIAVLALGQALMLGIFVLYATETLGLSDAGFGILLAVAALAHLVGGLVAGRVDGRLGSAETLAVGAAVAAGGYLAMGLATNVVVAAVGLVIEALAVAVANVATMTLRQRLIPPGQLGRVGNIFRFFIFGAIPIGALLGGLVATWIGLRAPILAAAAIALATAIAARLGLVGATRRRLEAPAPPSVSASAPG